MPWPFSLFIGSDYFSEYVLLKKIVTISCQLQVSSENNVKQAIKAAVDKCGHLRVSVNTAGIMRIAKTLSEAGEVHPLQIFEDITKV